MIHVGNGEGFLPVQELILIQAGVIMSCKLYTMRQELCMMAIVKGSYVYRAGIAGNTQIQIKNLATFQKR